METSIKKETLLRHIIKHKYLYLMLLPVVIWYVVFAYMPMYGVVMAFQKYSFQRGIFSPFIGWDNFRLVFSMPEIFRAIRNTFIINSIAIAIGSVVPVMFAISLSEIRHSSYKRSIQTITYLPHFISWVALAGIIGDLLTPQIGLINILLDNLGFEQIYFLISEKYFRWIVIITGVWKGFGWGSIIYLAAIAGIDPSLYEAAAIDGANRFRRIFNITLPCISSTFFIMFILAIGNITSSNTDQLLNLLTPLTYATGDVIDTYIFRNLQAGRAFGFLAAAGLSKSIVQFSLLVVADRLVRLLGQRGLFSTSEAGVK